MAIFQREDDQRQKELETVIGGTVTIDGTFVGAGDVIVEGRVSGTLRTSKNLQVGAGAVIKADVEAGNMLVAGEIRGQVKCSGKVELTATGKIYGNVDTQTIAVAHGAILHGKVAMHGATESVETPKDGKAKS